VSETSKAGNGRQTLARHPSHLRSSPFHRLKNVRVGLPRSLRARVGVAFSLVLVLASLIAAAYFVTRTSMIQLDAQRQQGEAALRLLAPALQAALPESRLDALDALAASVLADPAIGALRVRADRGATLIERSKADEPATWLTRTATAGLVERRTLSAQLAGADGGSVEVELTLAHLPLNRTIHTLVRDSLFFVVLLVALFALVSYTLLTRFTAPLKPLTEIARQVSRGNWLPKIDLIDSKSREIQELNRAFADGSAAMRHYIHNLEETRELLEHSESRLRTLINGMHEILFELDADGTLSFLNPAWERLTGFRVDEVLGRPFTDFIMERQVVLDFAPERLPELRDKNREICLRSATGKRVWVNLDADAQFDPAGRFIGIIGTLGDITQSVELNKLLTKYQDDLYYLSVTDPLTGLYNRRHFDTQLDVILTDRLAKNQSVCLLIIDLDGFKFINDTYGHPSGDEALRAIAGLLKRMVRRNDYIARLAGDEFAMVLKDTTLDDATHIANKVHAAISETYINLPIGHVQLQCSIGVAAAPTHGQKAQELVSAADVALYQSKRRGRNRVEVLSPDISKALMSIFSQGFQLRHALEQGNLMPAFQPICDIATGEPIAYEALARMQHGGATIKAGDFITVAEELGLTREIDLHIIEQALALAPMGYGLFLNLDPSSFNDRAFVTQLGELIGPACATGRSITIEITERENVTITDTLVADIQSLRRLGCKLALDDFGSGYSTYHFLNLFRPEYLKIEGAFVRGMLSNESDRKIVSHIHELASSFGIETIAESVENEATRKALLAMGIRNAQGWHLGHPRWFDEPDSRSA